MNFEVYRKRGRYWEYLGVNNAADSEKAARRAGYVHNLKVVGVRPDGSNAKLFVYRFKHVPTLTSC